MNKQRKGLAKSSQIHTGEQTSTVATPMLKWVGLTDIDRSDELFSINFNPDLSRLGTSIEQIGILQPIWVRRKGQKFQIVNGFRRFDVARSLGRREILALIWKTDDIDDRLAFQMSLHENVLTRELNPVEKGLVLEKLLSRFSMRRAEVIHTYLPLLDLEPNETVLSGLLLINTFSARVRQYVADHGLSLANVVRLGMFSRGEQESICGFLSRLRIGENVMREMLTFLREISQRDTMEIDDLFADPEIGHILSDSHLSGPQRIQATRRLLREMRYPSLSELEARFETWKKGTRLGPEVAITPPPFFEGDRFRIQIHFESVEEYETLLVKLQRLSGEGIKRLLTIKGYHSDIH